MRIPTFPRHIGPIAVPRDDVSAATWRWANAALPTYLLDHSIRSYCWGTTIANRQGWSFDRRILWTASLFHDLGLVRLARNTICFEVEGAEIARRFLERHGMPAAEADRAAIAIILHMQPNVTLADGVEAVLLDQATAIDVRGVELDTIEPIRHVVLPTYPRGSFDRRFFGALTREAARRPDCQSARFVERAIASDWPARTPWSAVS